MIKHLPLLLIAAAVPAAHAAIIYTEDFEVGATSSMGKSFADAGWSAYEADGTDQSASTSDPVYVLFDPGLNTNRTFTIETGHDVFMYTSEFSAINTALQTSIGLGFDH